MQQVPATHTREKCITLTAVSAASPPPLPPPPPPPAVTLAAQVGWIDFIEYITALEDEVGQTLRRRVRSRLISNAGRRRMWT